MKAADKTRLITFYEHELARHGPQDARSLHWISAGTQRTRFEALYQVGPWAGRSVADVGCGLGHLYGFLQDQGHRMAPVTGAEPEQDAECVRYLGYDVSPKLVEAARDNHPSGRFVVREVVGEGFESPADYVVASGTFNVRLSDHDRFFRDAIKAMYRACTIATAFNFLGLPSYGRWPGDDLYYEVEPQGVLAYCQTLCPQVELRGGYLANDYTVFMHKPRA